MRFTDTENYFVSEASVFSLSPAEGARPGRQPGFHRHEGCQRVQRQDHGPLPSSWQMDFTYLKVTGWGWFYLSTILDDFSRFHRRSKLCTTMKAEDVTATLDLALKALPGSIRRPSSKGRGCFPIMFDTKEVAVRKPIL